MSFDMTILWEDPHFLRQYLLGKLDEAATEAVERRMLADDDYFELVEAVEGDLLADCVSGLLSAEDKERALHRLASSPRGQQRLAISKELNILAMSLSNTHPMHQPKPIPFPLHLFTPRLPAVRFLAAAAGLFLVVGGFWLATHTAIPGGGAMMANRAAGQTASAVHRPVEPTPLVPHTAPAPSKAPLPAGERLAEERRPAAPREALLGMAPAVLTLALDTVRGGEAPENVFHVRTGQDVEIRMPISPADDFPTYRAVILNADEEKVVQQDGLKAQTDAGDSPLVVVTLRAGELPQGTYQMNLRGVGRDGETESLGKPWFDVRIP
jgi:hypothetical protein